MIIKVIPKKISDNYEIRINRGLLSKAGMAIKKLKHNRVIVLTNSKVKKLLYGQLKKALRANNIKVDVITIPDGEKYKNFKSYEYIISEMIKLKTDRYSAFITLGGGVIGDMGGFVASTYMRRIDLIHIPTTLLAQIDSSIGGKLAIDHKYGKNLVGSFYNPRLVLTDPDVLDSLDDRNFLNGLFEAIKIAMVNNKNLLDYIIKNKSRLLSRNKNVIDRIVKQCVAEKVKIIQADPFDRGLRMILNFGHTFGHALETTGDYSKITHGEAVGWGMLLSLQISLLLKLIEPDQFESLSEFIHDMLGRKKLNNIDYNKIWGIMKHDKKTRDNQVRFILLRSTADPIIKSIDKKTFIIAIKQL